MQLHKFKEFLRHNLKENLPGYDVQIQMAPHFEKSIARTFVPAKDAKQSAVLLLLSQNINNKIQILLTLRSEKLKSHGGQISFPGGRADENETPEETALREALEEIDLKSENVEIIGRLSNLYVPPSNSYIYPIVAFSDDMGRLTPNQDEVSELIMLELDKIASKDSIQYFPDKFGNKIINFPYWDIHPTTKLWGATAIILYELIYLYNDFIAIQKN